MAKLFIEDSSLTAIGNAIRRKTGSTDLLTVPDGMVEAINSIEGGGGDVGTITLSGDCKYAFAGDTWNRFLNNVVTEDLTDCSNMFQYNTLSEIPITLNFSSDLGSVKTTYMFSNCESLESIPTFNNLSTYNLYNTSNMFYFCNKLISVPDFLEENNTGERCEMFCANNMFAFCYSLRNISENVLKQIKLSRNSYFDSFYYGAFSNCYSLDEVQNISIQATLYSNAFYSTFDSCYRLKDIIFNTSGGAAINAVWNSQVIDLTKNVGYTSNVNNFLNSSFSITADKEVTDATTYAALKDDPDWFTGDVAYSRYNHDSAVNTINSLPNVSQAVVNANTIKFKGDSGSSTDGGAISTLTSAEIAVATAKGWTVTLV